MDINLLLIAGGGIAGILLLVGIVSSLTGERTLVEERLGRYIEDEKESSSKSQVAQTPLTDWLNRRVEKSSFGANTAKELARADIKLKPGEYIALMGIAAFGVGFIAWYLGGKFLLVGAIGAIFGLFLPRLYVRREQGKRLIRFDEQLGDMLNLMVNGLRAGYSTMQAMEAVSRELPSPISDEFRRVVQEMQLGLPMDRALDNLIRRIPSEDLDLVVTAINVQREVGGNLAEILDTISYTIRERVRIKGDIRVLTAQVMISGRFLAMMPIFVCVILWFLNREYMMEFFRPEAGICGYIGLGTGALLIISGYFVMNKLGEIEV
jgi:tight adherence protein B